MRSFANGVEFPSFKSSAKSKKLTVLLIIALAEAGSISVGKLGCINRKLEIKQKKFDMVSIESHNLDSFRNQVLAVEKFSISIGLDSQDNA